MTTDRLRQNFLDFFKSKKHKILASDSLVPADDPTVLFTPAGMNQFKKEFLGKGRPLKRAATAQRCLRMDDLDKVGKTSGHHTFFEMLGNFSFGDYGKEEAIAFAWEFLVDVLKIDKRKLWVSVYKEDKEAYRIWKNKIGLAEKKIEHLGDKENFWPSQAKTKGPNGPCGPCSEIFFNQGRESVEVWNLVFTQFNRRDNGILVALPRKNIDTGMGLERLASLMQGVDSNFKTDLFQPIIKEIVSACRKEEAGGRKELVYAVADYIRAIVFAIYDGIVPSNEERGYVVRKLIRKAVVNLKTVGVTAPFLYRLAPLVCEIMHNPYPDLRGRRENISQIILSEEKNFVSLLDSVPDLLAKAFGDKDKDSGEVAFQLYDTHGVPIEIASDWLKEHNLSFNRERFKQLLTLQKERSKQKGKMETDVFYFAHLPIKARKTNFIGYGKTEARAQILALIKEGRPAEKIEATDEAEIVLDKTPFYPESGGQIGDKGSIIRGKNIFEVIDTKKQDGLILHVGKVKQGGFKKDNPVLAKIDDIRRKDIARNHTATHILQAALRRVLGKHVKQQGSLVSREYLRFDFTHFQSISLEELSRIEELVNQYIWNNDQVVVKAMSLSQARQRGALAFFAEKYGQRVKVVSIGDYSCELCGGTHLSSTGEIGLFKILSTASVASGIRRIEATTSRFAYARVKQMQEIITEASQRIKAPETELLSKIEKLTQKLKDLEKGRRTLSQTDLNVYLNDLLSKAEDLSGIKLIVQVIPELDTKVLASIIDLVKVKLPKSICLLVAQKANQAFLLLGVGSDLVDRGFKAAGLIREVAVVMGGSGGGRADFAQGAGDINKIELGFNRLREIILEK